MIRRGGGFTLTSADNARRVVQSGAEGEARQRARHRDFCVSPCHHFNSFSPAGYWTDRERPVAPQFATNTQMRMKLKTEAGRVEFALGARRHAERRGRLGALESVLLPAHTQVDDVVELDAARDADAFIVRSRRLALDASGGAALVLLAGQPPRPSR